MITEIEILNALTGSFLGNYPVIFPSMEIKNAASQLFLKILGITSASSMPNELFNVSSADDPSSVANYYVRSYIEPQLRSMRIYMDVDLPTRIKKLNALLDPYTFTDDIEQRELILKARGSIDEIFEVYGVQLPIIAYNFFGG